MASSPSTGSPATLRRDLGKVHSYAALIGILVGAGIYKVTQEAYVLTGPSVVLGYVLLAPVVLAIAIPYAAFQATSIAAGPGGDYAHIRAVFGPGPVAFLAAWLKIIAYLGALSYLATTTASYLIESTQIATGWQAEVATWQRPVATLCMLGFFVIHCAGVRWFGRVQVAMCVLLGVSIVLLVVPGVFAIRWANLRPFAPGGIGGFVSSLPILFFAYAGFEALAHTSGEVRHGQRDLPSVYLRGIVATTIIFFLMSVVVVGVLSAAEVTGSDAPMAAAAAKFLPGGAALVVAIGGVFAAATSVNATMIVPPRLAITVAQDGSLPKGLAVVHAGTGTPVLGLSVTFLISLGLMWSGQQGFALNVALLALMSVYLVHSFAYLCWFRRDRELTESASLGLPRPLRWGAAAVALLALAALIATLVYADVRTITASSIGDRWRDQSLTGTELLIVWSLVGLALYRGARASNRLPS